MSTTYQYQMQILERHLDTFGHVNNATYLEIYEEARWDVISQKGFGLKKIQEKQIGPVILDLQLAFKAELKNREMITIETNVGEMKNRMVCVFHQRILKADGTVASTLDLSIGLMDLKARKLIAPTPEWMNAIQ